MKKNPIILAVLALMVGSCAKNESGKPEGTPGTVVFEIVTDDAPSARGGVIYGAEAQSEVSQVTIYSFKESSTPGEFLYDETLVVPGWSSGDTSGEYTVTNAVLDGNYKFLAVGLESDASTVYNAIAPQEGDEFDDFTATLLNGPETTTPIYSGSAEETLSAGQYERVTITIKRVVSGIMIYLKDIPIELEGKVPATLRLTTTSDLNESVNLVSGLGGELGETDLTDPLALISIPLINPDEASGVFGRNAVPGGVLTLDNSQLGGTFILPTATGEGVKLTLGLYDAGGVMIKEWPLNGGADIPLVRNVLYALGTKNLSTSPYGSDDTPDGDPAPTDDTKDDDALDIMTNQLILVEVEGAWDTIENLTLN